MIHRAVVPEELHPVHFGHVAERVAARQKVMDAAFDAHPERFPRGRPRVEQPRPAAWINPPVDTSEPRSPSSATRDEGHPPAVDEQAQPDGATNS